MGVWLLAASVLLVGCDRVYGLDAVENAVDAAGLDAPACVMPEQSDAFDASEACSDWGYPLSGAAVEQLIGGELVLLPPAAGKNTGCVSKIPFGFGPSGVFVEVPAVGTGHFQYNSLQLFWNTQRTDSSSIGVTDMIRFTAHGSLLAELPYDPVSARWWRMRPSKGGVVAEFSADGRAWTLLGSDATAPPAICMAQIQSGLADGGSGATAMHVASFDVCP